MRRPQRRLHLVMWIAIAPAIAAALILALRNAPADPVTDLPGVAVTDEAR